MFRSDGRVLLWDIRSPKSCLTSFDYIKSSPNTSINKSRICSSERRAHEGHVNSLAFVHNGFYLISIGNDCYMRLWNVVTGLNTFINYGKFCSRPKSEKISLQISTTELSEQNYVFAVNGRNISVYSLFDGICKVTFKGHFDTVNSCIYNPTLNEVYSGGRDRNILVWSTYHNTCNIFDQNHEENVKQSHNSSLYTDSKHFSSKIKKCYDSWSDEN